MARFLQSARARTAVASVQVPVHVGIYVRKSSDENLDSAFNSLDAQREACLAYISSQKHEGWVAHSETFEDPAYSGGTLDRPALQRLLKAVETGEVQCVAVYRADRLSRRLLDFLQLVEFLDGHGCAFVSITEQFNTSTPGGRLYQHMLLSFAEYERALIGERTRHKLAASRRRGKYVGGYPVLGYDRAPEGARLVVNKAEAETVREIFRLFLEKRSLVVMADELARRGWTLKRWTTRDGKEFGGGRFDKNNLRRMLTNHVYIGKVNFQGTIYDGEHDAIVSPKVFREVQRILEDNRRDGGASQRNRCGALLRGILRCASCDAPMIHTWTKKGTKAYRFYRCSASMKRGAHTCPTRSIHAAKVEEFVVAEIKRIGADPMLQRATFEQALAQLKAQRRGLRLEEKRLRGDLTKARSHVKQLVGAITRTTGPAADAIQCELARAQGHVSVTEVRQREIQAEAATIAAQDVDEAAVARALHDFDELWSVLLVGERERILRLLIAGIRYDGSTGKLDIDWRLAGFGELAEEVGGA